MSGRPEFVFFTDRDLGRRFAEILSSAGPRVERHGDHFAPDTADEVWLATVGKRGWVAITHDQHIRYRPNELGAVMRNGVALLVVVGKAPFPELARSFVATLPHIERFLLRNEPPYIAKVYRPTPTEAAAGIQSGRVERWHP